MISLHQVSFSYRKRGVLDGLSLDVGDGTVAAVLGPNGAGKSTLLDICLGWRRPSEGTVQISGKNLDEMSARERGRTVSLVPQRENVRFDFPVIDYVLLGRAPHLPPLSVPGRTDREIAVDAMEKVGIAHLSRRPIVELSGGEYQLMLIARSLAQQPRVMLLDEPTSQLDPAHRLAVLKVLDRIASAGITVLMTSHSPETAALIANELHLMHAGKIARSGSPKEVLTKDNLEMVYGVPFIVKWLDGSPHFSWKLE